MGLFKSRKKKDDELLSEILSRTSQKQKNKPEKKLPEIYIGSKPGIPVSTGFIKLDSEGIQFLPVAKTIAPLVIGLSMSITILSVPPYFYYLLKFLSGMIVVIFGIIYIKIWNVVWKRDKIGRAMRGELEKDEILDNQWYLKW